MTSEQLKIQSITREFATVYALLSEGSFEREPSPMFLWGQPCFRRGGPAAALAGIADKTTPVASNA